MSIRVLLTWYGSIPGNGTIGDLLALQAVANHLMSRGFRVQHVSETCDAELPVPSVSFENVSPEDVDVLVFVCGPLLGGHKLLPQILDRFPDTPRIAVSVSLMKREAANYVQPFDVVLAREGANETFEDVAVLGPLTAVTEEPPADRLVIGLALRGAQSEYGKHRCRHQEVERLADDIIDHLGHTRPIERAPIEHHLTRAGCSPADIEWKYQRCHLVITSRFHGGILSLRNSVPFIAIDQIDGGAKVHSLLSPTEWPWIIKANEAKRDVLCNAAEELIKGAYSRELDQARSSSRAGAAITLERLELTIRNLHGRERGP